MSEIIVAGETGPLKKKVSVSSHRNWPQESAKKVQTAQIRERIQNCDKGGDKSKKWEKTIQTRQKGGTNLK